MPDIDLPDGFQINVLTDEVPNARSMTLGDEMIFVSTRSEGKIYAITNYQDNPKVFVLASGLYMPNGIAFHENDLYVAEIHRVLKFENIEESLNDLIQNTSGSITWSLDSKSFFYSKLDKFHRPRQIYKHILGT